MTSVLKAAAPFFRETRTCSLLGSVCATSLLLFLAMRPATGQVTCQSQCQLGYAEETGLCGSLTGACKISCELSYGSSCTDSCNGDSSCISSCNSLLSSCNTGCDIDGGTCASGALYDYICCVDGCTGSYCP